MVVQAGDERPHEPSDQPGWQEAWDFTFAAPDLSLAGYLRLAIVPAERAAWCWAAVVGLDQPVVAVRHHELAPPSGWPHAVRGEGLWCGVFCETPMEHWTVGLEAFGVRFDDLADAWGSERGDLVPLGFDLEWEDVAGGPTMDVGGGYRRWCAVHGEVLLGADALAIDAAGWRAHTWRAERWDHAEPSDAGGTPKLLSPVLVPPHRVMRGVVVDDEGGGSGRPRWEEWRGAAATEVAEEVERTA